MSQLTKVAKFTKALGQLFLLDHGKFLSKEQILERFEICKKCKFFTGSACRKCGCGCGVSRRLLNKLAHPRQHCPMRYWD